MRHRERERLRQVRDDLKEAGLPVLLGDHVLHRGEDPGHSLTRGGRKNSWIVGERLPAGLVPDVLLPLNRVCLRARHDNLDRATVIGTVVPLGPEPHDRLVEIRADPAAHADDHRLAIHGLKAALEVLDKIWSYKADAFLSTHHSFKASPLALEFLFGRLLLAFGDLLELGVDL